MKKVTLLLLAGLLLVSIALPIANAKPPASEYGIIRLYGTPWGEITSATPATAIARARVDTNEGDQTSSAETESKRANLSENRLDFMTFIRIGLIKFKLLLH